MAEAVTRIILGEPGKQIRIYFDADEQLAAPIIEHQCETCGAWWKQDGHIPPCSPEQHMADMTERVNRNIMLLEMSDGTRD